MHALEFKPPTRPLFLALAVSLLIHGLLLSLRLQQQAPVRPPANSGMDARLELARPARAAPPPVAQSKPQAPRHEARAAQTPTPRVLTARQPSPTQAPTVPPANWSIAQKQEMDNFLNDLSAEQKRPQPNLAERSMAMAREVGREMGREMGQNEARRSSQGGGAALVERIPNSPELDPFSLEMYMDALVKKLNRSASFVRNDPRSRGVQSAAIQVRINPDGSLKSFEVVRTGDQREEIEFVKSVVERAIPFASFPADLVQSARSLGLMICIQPAGSGGGFGFTRRSSGGC